MHLPFTVFPVCTFGMRFSRTARLRLAIQPRNVLTVFVRNDAQNTEEAVSFITFQHVPVP